MEISRSYEAGKTELYRENEFLVVKAFRDCFV